MKKRQKRNENYFTRILRDTWGDFRTKCSSYATPYYDDLIEKVLHCRDPKFGYVEYVCTSCGKGFHRSGFSCKSKFCIHCARKSSKDFMEEMMGKLHPGIVYRHLILTIPEQLRVYFYQKRVTKDLYNEFIRLAKDYVEDVFRTITRKKKLEVGCVVVLHMAGRKGSFNPHLHVIVMNGGIDPDSGKWIEIGYFKYDKILPRKWQWHLLNMLKHFDSSPAMLSLIKKLWKKYKKGFVNNFKKGDVPKKMGHLIKYLAKYISKPSISVSSILKCNFKKKLVTYRYKDHRTQKTVVTTCSFMDFVGRLAQQILPKCFHRIRYFGLQHPSSFQRRFQEITSSLMKTGRNISKDTFVAYAVGNWKWDLDHRTCTFCGAVMEVYKIWSKKYGEIYHMLHDARVVEDIPPPIENNEEVLPPEYQFLESCYEQQGFEFTSGQALAL